MPVVGKEDIAAINMFRRCKEWNVLPRTGGLMDQDEQEMQTLDVIAEELNLVQKQRAAADEIRGRHGN